MKKITLMFIAVFSFSLLLAQVEINEDFDSGTPSGWTDDYVNSSSAACEGNSERVNMWSFNSSGNLTSPNFVGASNATDLVVSFDYKILDYSFGTPTDATTAGWGTAELQFSIDDGVNWATALTIDDNNHVISTDCANMMTTIPASSLPNGSDVKLRILNTWTAGDYFFYVDNFSAQQTVSCARPTNGAIVNIAETTIDFTWTDEPNSSLGYEVEIGVSGFSPGTGSELQLVTVAQGVEIVSFSGLSEFTDYDIYIRSNCDADGYSTWAGPFPVTTLATPPDCPETPISPVDADSDTVLVSGTLTLSWTAPSNGPTPTGYEFFLGTTSGNLSSLGTTSDTFIDLINVQYATTYYWRVVSLNETASATGCPEYSFTTEALPAAPANDDCANAIVLVPGSAYGDNPVDGTVVAATADAEDVDTCGEPGPGVWYSVMVPDDGNITIETAADISTGTGNFDSVIEAFSGTCGSLVSIECDDDGATGLGNFSQLVLTGQTPGSIIYIRVWEYNGDETEPFSISAFNATLDVNRVKNEITYSYYPNPVKNTLTLNAQKNIESVTIYNILGQEVLRMAPNAVDSEVDMSGFQNGTYFVKVTIESITETVRVVKQ